MSDAALALINPSALFHIRRIERALEDAQCALRGDTPEIGTHEEAIADTLDQVRDALLRHLPEIRKLLIRKAVL